MAAGFMRYTFCDAMVKVVRRAGAQSQLKYNVCQKIQTWSDDTLGSFVVSHYTKLCGMYVNGLVDQMLMMLHDIVSDVI